MSFDLFKDNLIEDIKKSNYDELDELCDEMRDFLIQSVSETGGHLAPNLGVVELTIALHKCYNSPVDKFIFDVGHQSYIHKIITGRAKYFNNLRKYKGLSGFPKTAESEHDIYETGHSSTSLSAAFGIAAARDLNGDSYQVIPIIGDGSMTGGEAYEALNNIGSTRKNIKIVLNDNGMSISKNVGAITKHLTKLRSSKDYQNAKTTIRSTINTIPVVGNKLSENISKTKEKIKFSVLSEHGVLFEEMGIKYIGPVDGHDIQSMTEAFEAANKINGPTLVHVITRKGIGYKWSEIYPNRFHGIGAFDISTGKPTSAPAVTYSKVLGSTVFDIATQDKRIVAVTAAMGTATGLSEFSKAFPDRYFDVGIAEQHAVTFAAGLAAGGQIPVVAIYSTFLQRAYDQLIEDVCLQNLHVVFAVDRAGLVGADGETHQGQFDISYLNTMPNMKIYCPANGEQLEEIIRYAVKASGPCAVRYPRGNSVETGTHLQEFSGHNVRLSEGTDVMILAVGNMLTEAFKAASILERKGYSVGIENVCVVKPFENPQLDTKLVVTVEDNIKNGGYGSSFDLNNINSDFGILNISLPDQFIEQGSVDELRSIYGIAGNNIVEGVLNYFEGKA